MSFRSLVVLCCTVASSFTFADSYKPEFTYEVTITNITRGQTFTPQLVVAHNPYVSLFELGEPASPELAILAESGNTQPLTELLNGSGDVGEVKTVDGLLGPGESVVTEINANPWKHRVLSFGAMLIPTNDTFVAADSVRLPWRGVAKKVLKAYDAGTEYNDQNCANIPGPRCGGAALSEPSEKDEGYVYISNGFHELGAKDKLGNEILSPAVYDWRNPVAKITVRRVK